MREVSGSQASKPSFLPKARVLTGRDTASKAKGNEGRRKMFESTGSAQEMKIVL